MRTRSEKGYFIQGKLGASRNFESDGHITYIKRCNWGFLGKCGSLYSIYRELNELLTLLSRETTIYAKIVGKHMPQNLLRPSAMLVGLLLPRASQIKLVPTLHG